jgi:hypothetical protein
MGNFKLNFLIELVINFLGAIVGSLAVYYLTKPNAVIRRLCYALLAAILIFLAIYISSTLCFWGLYDKQTYWPPDKTGEIYTVIEKKSRETICLAAEWGEWKKKDRINIANYKGLVLHLNHLNRDRFSLTVKAKYAIVRTPNQGEPPSEWQDLQFKQVSW